MPETHEPEHYRIPTPDGKTATMVRTWTDAQIERMLRGALALVETLEPPEDLRQAVFATALNLTGQMAPRTSGITIAPPLSALDGKG